MRTIENESITNTTQELLDNAIDGIRSKIAKLHIAAYQEVENNNEETGKLIAFQSEIIQNAINSLKELREKL